MKFDEDAHFEAGAQRLFYFIFVSHPLIITFNGILLLASIRQGGLSSSSELLNLNIYLAEVISHTVSFIVDAYNVGQSANRIPGYLCQISGVFMMVCQASSVTTILLIALQRYSIVVLWWRPWSKRLTLMLLFCTYVVYLAIFILPTLGLDTVFADYRLTSFGAICATNFRVRDKPGQLVLNILCLGIVVLGSSLLLFVYFSIYITMRKTSQTLLNASHSINLSNIAQTATRAVSRVPSFYNKNMERNHRGVLSDLSRTSHNRNTSATPDMLSNSNSETSPKTEAASQSPFLQVPSSTSLAPHLQRRSSIYDPKTLSSGERVMVRRAFMITGAFIIIWSPVGSLIAYMLLTGDPPTWMFEGTVFGFVSMTNAWNPIFLAIVDKNYRQAVTNLFRCR